MGKYIIIGAIIGSIIGWVTGFTVVTRTGFRGSLLAALFTQ